MRLVIDANILFAALIKNGLTRKIICNDRIELFAPKFLQEEMLKYIIYIEQKAKIPNIYIITKELLSTITFIQDDQLKDHWSLANDISADIKDTAYVATALALNYPLWSNDKTLKRIENIKVLNTTEVVELIEQQ